MSGCKKGASLEEIHNKMSTKRPREDSTQPAAKKPRLEPFEDMDSTDSDTEELIGPTEDPTLVKRVRVMLEYIRLTGLYNMVMEYDNAILSALLCGLSFGGLTSRDISAYVSSPELQRKIQTAFLTRTLEEAELDRQEAEVMPYSEKMEQMVLKHGFVTDVTYSFCPEKAPSSHMFIEKLRDKVLERGKFMRENGTRGIQVYNNDLPLMWAGIQLVSEQELAY